MGKEKLLVKSNFSFSHSVFKWLVSQGRQKVSLCGNGLTSVLDNTKIVIGLFNLYSDIFFFREKVHLAQLIVSFMFNDRKNCDINLVM